MSWVEFLLSNSGCSIYHWKLALPQMFLVSVLRIFKIAGRSSVVEPIFIKVTGKISAFYNCFEKSITCIGMFRKAALQKISSCLLAVVVGLQSASCNATKNEHLTKFAEDIWKSLENFWSSFLVNFRPTYFKPQSGVFFEIPETPWDNFCCSALFHRSKQRSEKLLQSGLTRDSTIDVYLRNFLKILKPLFSRNTFGQGPPK